MREDANAGKPKALVKRFERECGLYRRTARNYAVGAAKLAEYLESERMAVSEIDCETLFELRSRLEPEHTGNTLQSYLRGIRAFVFWLADEGIVERDAAEDIRRRFRCHNEKVGLGCGAIEPELIERYLLTFDVAGGTVKSYRTDLRCFSRYLEHRGTTLEDADEAVLAEFAMWLKRNRTDSVARKVMSEVRALYRWLEKEGLHGNVAKGVIIGKKEQGYVREPLTPETARLILETAESGGETPQKGLRDRLVMELVLVCAMRPGELSVLDVGHVSFVGKVSAVAVPAGKRRLESIVYVPEGTTRLMRRYISERNASAGDPLIASVPSRSHPEGRRLTSGTIGQIISKTFSKAGVEGNACSWNLTRTSIEIAVSLGANEEELRRFGRFRSPVPLGNLAHSARGNGLALQDGIEDILSCLEPRSAVKVTSAREIRALLDGLDDEAMVVIKIGDEGGLSIEPVSRP